MTRVLHDAQIRLLDEQEKRMHRHNLWIALFAATATLGTTATQADFIDDSNVQLKFKNFYLGPVINQLEKI